MIDSGQAEGELDSMLKGALAETKKKLVSPSSNSCEKKYLLRLYVNGVTPRSKHAFKAVTDICQKHLAGCYDLEVVDIRQHPALAKGDQIVAVPTLIKKLPQSLRQLIGSMVDEDKVLIGLDLKEK